MPGTSIILGTQISNYSRSVRNPGLSTVDPFQGPGLHPSAEGGFWVLCRHHIGQFLLCGSRITETFTDHKRPCHLGVTSFSQDSAECLC